MPADLEKREAMRRELVPAGYSPWIHLGITSVAGLGLIVTAALLLRHVRPLELLTVPIVFVLSNMTEWRAHRDILHKRTWYAPVLYDRHTPEHHVIFPKEDMSIRSPGEFRLVLIPAYGIVVIFLGGALPITAALWALHLRNVAMLYVITSMGYVVSYEWLHLSYHLPPTTFIGRMKLIGVLRRHHATHHDPSLMQRWNFNVTLPLWDWIRGTIYRGQG
jgi:hypothetical protein